jgi:hypothetical protein
LERLDNSTMSRSMPGSTEFNPPSTIPEGDDCKPLGSKKIEAAMRIPLPLSEVACLAGMVPAASENLEIDALVNGFLVNFNIPHALRLSNCANVDAFGSGDEKETDDNTGMFLVRFESTGLGTVKVDSAAQPRGIMSALSALIISAACF